jgi:hypothetical protein
VRRRSIASLTLRGTPSPRRAGEQRSGQGRMNRTRLRAILLMLISAELVLVLVLWLR